MVRIRTAAAAMLLCACGMSAEEQACNDLIDAFADYAERCGEDREYARKVFYAAAYECNVEAVRDEAALRKDCIPRIAALSCEAVQQPDWLPESCKNQFVLARQ